MPAFRDCIYFHKRDGSNTEVLIPYCRRDTAEDRVIDCGRHEKFTFDEIRRKQITQQDLNDWFAPIDTQNDYGKYLQHERQGGEQVFCNCSAPWFGVDCQYSNRSSTISFMALVEQQFKSKIRHKDIFKDPVISCYTGLMCETRGACLDWRQVCNGVRDCKHGEDEDPCLQMELNHCNVSNEYRCKNGMCIARVFFVDLMPDCLDDSDEDDKNVKRTYRRFNCFETPSILCEEYMCAWLKTSCGDGVCVASPIDDCDSGRTVTFQRQWLSESFNTVGPGHGNCSSLVLCQYAYMLHFMRLKSTADKICQKISVSLFAQGWNSDTFLMLLQDACLTNFAFPRIPILHPPVRLIYSKYSFDSYLPKYICYETPDACPMYPAMTSLLLDNSSVLYCRNYTHFPLNSWKEKDYDFHKFIAQLQNILSYCTLNCPVNNDNLFRCNASQQCLSPHRVLNGEDDCVGNEKEDEKSLRIWSSALSECLLCGLHEKTKCIHRKQALTFGTQKLCAARTPILELLRCEIQGELGCRFIRGEVSTLQEYFVFQEHCNLNTESITTVILEADRVACVERQYECNTRYGQCDCSWQCKSGEDELNCKERQTNPINTGCKANEHYCYRPEINSIIRRCLHKSRINDGVIDCLGATDERLGHCPLTFPGEPDRRFHCRNSSLCVPIHDVCDGRSDCPSGDDEWPCQDRYKSKCPKDTFPIFGDGDGCIKDDDRCRSSESSCAANYEDIFCDLIYQPSMPQLSNLNFYTAYPVRSDRIIITTIEPTVQDQVLVPTSIPSPECGRGFAIFSGHCLCPPSYYGNACQFQADRVTIVMQIDPQPSVYDLHTSILTFLVRIDGTTHHERVLHFHHEQGLLKHIVYLLTPKDKRPISVRIDAFLVTPTHVQHKTAWLFDVPFPFLPVNRLAFKLDVGQGSSLLACSIMCVHGVCMRYENKSPARHYCKCHETWMGSACNTPSTMQCAKLAVQVQQICVCPLGRFGDHCYLQLNVCHPRACLNGGLCVPFDHRIVPGYVCQCSKYFFGKLCESRSATTVIHMPMRPKGEERDHIPLVLVHLLDMDSGVALMAIRDRFLFTNVLFGTNLSIAYSDKIHLPEFVFVQLLSSTDTLHGAFHLVGLSSELRRAITTGMLASNYCPNVSEVLDENIMKLAYITRIKYYHRPCLALGTRCFHDEKYLCLCDDSAHFECFLFDHNEANCSTRDLCKNGAHCFQARQKQPTLDFGCACPKCYYGSLCQFTTTQYSITLDVLFDQNLHTTVGAALGMTFTGLLTNSFALLVFIKKKTRDVGCGLYLLALNVVAQVGLLVFAAKLLILLHGSQTLVSCIIVEHLLKILPSIFDWLTACIAVERMVIVSKGASFNKTLSQCIAKIIVPTVIVSIFLSAFHGLFYRRLVSDPRFQNQIWCIMKLPPWLNQYETVNNIFHLVTPFLINFFATMVLIRNLVKRKSASSLTSATDTYGSILSKQLHIYKSFIISPLIILVLELPRLVLAFAFACMTKPWQNRIYLASYIVSCIPYTTALFIYVWPSTTYKTELRASVKLIVNRFRSVLRTVKQ